MTIFCTLTVGIQNEMRGGIRNRVNENIMRRNKRLDVVFGMGFVFDKEATSKRRGGKAKGIWSVVRVKRICVFSARMKGGNMRSESCFLCFFLF